MLAVYYDKYGSPDVLSLRTQKKPVPKANEVLIEIKASSVTRFDSWARSGRSHLGMTFFHRLWFGLAKPRQPILGTELSGVISETGNNVRNLKKGDRVFASPGIHMGANAEYICLPEDKVSLMPDNMTYEEAAGVLQGGLTAYEFLKRAEISKGRRILILGASGGVGMYAVQIAKNLYGAQVTGVCRTDKMEFVKSLGADCVIDYSRQNIDELDQKFDVIFDTYGVSSLKTYRLLKNRGAFLFATQGVKHIALMLFINLFTTSKGISPLLNVTKEGLNILKNLVELGVVKSVIDRTFPLENVSEAHRHLDSGRKKGNIILTHTHSYI